MTTTAPTVSSRIRLPVLGALLILAALTQLTGHAPAAAQPLPPDASLRHPLRLVVPAIGVDAPVAALDLTGDGTMPAPAGAAVVAWYTFSAPAGRDGNVVLAGHRDWQGRRGVFFALGQLRLEDEVWLQDTTGSWSRYTVVWSASYPDAAAPLEALLGPTERPALTLITCSGAFDRGLGRYLERRVVRAELTDVVPSLSASEPARSTSHDAP